MGTRWANRRRDTRARVPHFCNNPRDRTRIQDGDDAGGKREREKEMRVFYLIPVPRSARGDEGGEHGTEFHI